MEPFGREDGGEETSGTGDGGGETASKEGRTVDEKEELVGGFAAVGTTVESDGNDIVVDGGRGDGHTLHWAATDDDAGEVDLTVGGEAVFVDATEMQIGIRVIAAGRIGQPDFVWSDVSIVDFWRYWWIKQLIFWLDTGSFPAHFSRPLLVKKLPRCPYNGKFTTNKQLNLKIYIG